eukprot:gnl/Spiro4/21843_TR10715_c0_g1_i1.p1 gnl/Spiro4/21843_TR10715_c0_g1~~gnl/Spiro4/21843_TR10715_c0_g1_i1.p1  ORF type:complete len:525 (+),score=150.53 gnl/Spiro4/21843_TR10715_c0_g1_i1:32-1576(+)
MCDDIEALYSAYRHGGYAARLSSPTNSSFLRSSTDAECCYQPVVPVAKPCLHHAVELESAKQMRLLEKRKLEQKQRAHQRASEHRQLRQAQELSDQLTAKKLEHDRLSRLYDFSSSRESILRRENSEMLNKIRSLHAELQEECTRVVSLESHIDGITADLRLAHLSSAELETRLKEEQVHRAAAAVEVEKSNERLKLQQLQVDALALDRNDMEQRMRDIKEQLGLANLQLQQKTEELATQASGQDLQRRALERTIATLKDELESKNVQVNRLLEDNKNKSENTTAIQATIAESKSQIATLAQEKKHYKKQLRELQDVVKARDAEIAAAKLARVQLERRIVEHSQARDSELATQQANASQAVAELNKTKQTFQTKIQKMKKKHQEAISDRDRRLQALADQVSQSEVELRTVMEELLQRRSENALLKNEGRVISDKLRACEDEVRERAAQYSRMEDQVRRTNEVVRALQIDHERAQHTIRELESTLNANANGGGGGCSQIDPNCPVHSPSRNNIRS